MKGDFKFKKTYNFTTEQDKNRQFKYMLGTCTMMIFGTLTHADKDYIYGEFLRNGEEDCLIDFGDISLSEIR